MPLVLIKNPYCPCKYQGIRYRVELRLENDIYRKYINEELDRLIYREILMTRKEEADKKKKEHDKMYDDFINKLKTKHRN